ncbi:MAG: pseudouridine synthase [Peptococcaceae bacterium]|nr:pseudouridine synthase [Peptococcaceae bacterium]
MTRVRLQKYMADCGVASRRQSEKMITQGRVKVNGQIVKELGTQITPGEDCVSVDDKDIAVQDEYLFYMFNKPAGYLTTTQDPQGRPTIFDCFPELKGRVLPVGRLDMDTEGLLLLTNHGELAYRLTHPKYNIKKTYIATVKGVITFKALQALSEGVTLDDGKTAPAQARFLKKQGKNSVVELIIHEGKKRQVRRMLEAVGFPCLQLRRVAIDKLTLSHVDLGQIRPLTNEELGRLFDRVQLSRSDYLNKRI